MQGAGTAPATEIQPSAVTENTNGTMLPLLWLLWSRRRFVAGILVVGMTISLVVALCLPKEYQSTVRLMPPDSKTGAMGLLAGLMSEGGAGIGLGDLLGSKTPSALFINILQSRTVQDRIVDRFNLREVYKAKYQEQARQTLAERTSISEDMKSGVITLSVLDRSPQRAAEIANAYVEELDRLSASLTTSAAHRERVFIEERLKQVKRELDDAAGQFSRFSSKTGAIDIKEQGKAIVGAAAQVRAEVAAAESELRGLQQVYTDNNVRVKALKARIAELRKELTKAESPKPTTATDSDPARDSLGTSLQKLPLLSVPYADLYRRAQVQAAVYEVLTKQYELAKVQEAKEIPTVRVLDNGQVPERKSRPKRALVVIFGSAVSLLLAVFLVFGQALWQAVPDTDPRKAFAVEVARVLPRWLRSAFLAPGKAS